MTISGAPREPAAPIAHALTRRGRAEPRTGRGRAEPRTGRGRENRLRSGRYCSRMAASSRAFILRHTRLRPVPGLEEICDPARVAGTRYDANQMRALDSEKLDSEK